MAKGGDGGAQARMDADKKRQDEAIARINTMFGKTSSAVAGTRSAPSQQDYMTTNPNIDPRWGTEDGLTATQPDLGAYDRAVSDTNAFNADLRAKQEADVTANAAAREKLYGQVGSDAKSVVTGQLADQFKRASMNTRIALARRGLTGGGADINAMQEIRDANNQGLIKAEQAGQLASNTAKTADENARMSLLESIRNGMSEGDAATAATAKMDLSLSNARDQANQTDLAEMFNNIGVLNAQQAMNEAYLKKYNQAKYGGASGFNGNLQ